jgi:hypothetical protein
MFNKSHKGNALTTSAYQTMTARAGFSNGFNMVRKTLRVYTSIHMNLFNVLQCPETILQNMTCNNETSSGVREEL